MYRAAAPDEAYVHAVLHDLRDLLTVVDRQLDSALNQPELHAHLLALRRHVSELIQSAVDVETS